LSVGMEPSASQELLVQELGKIVELVEADE